MKAVDFSGNLTISRYNERNLLVEQIIGFRTSAARRTTATWDSSFRPPTASTQPGQLTTFVYDAHGDKLKQTQCSADDPDDYRHCNSDDTVMTQSWTYNAAGRIANMSAAGPLLAKSFGYDVLDRVTAYASGPQTQNFAYDANGNRTKFSETQPSSISLTYAYDPASNKLLAISGSSSESFAYDADGNIVSDTTPSATYAFTFDAKNRLAQATHGALTTTYGINGLGQRVSKTDASGNVTVFAYDEASHLVGEYDGKGNAIEETVWLGDLPVAKISGAGTLYVAPDHLNAAAGARRRDGRGGTNHAAMGSRAVRRRSTCPQGEREMRAGKLRFLSSKANEQIANRAIS